MRDQLLLAKLVPDLDAAMHKRLRSHLVQGQVIVRSLDRRYAVIVDLPCRVTETKDVSDDGIFRAKLVQQLNRRRGDRPSR